MSRILIIGSEGQLGSELSKFLKSNSDSSKIILSDIKEKSNSNLKYFKLNALKSKELEVRLANLDITYDFKEFEKQIGDAIVNTGVVNKLKNLGQSVCIIMEYLQIICSLKFLRLLMKKK